MSAFSRFTPLISALPSTVPFVGPEAIERQRGHAVLARIGANENGFGPAPSVLAAMREEAHNIWKYNDPENFALREALAAHLGVAAANIAIGSGIDELLGQIVRLVIEPGAPVVTSLGAYPTFNFHVAGFGGRLVTVPYITTARISTGCSMPSGAKMRRSSISPIPIIRWEAGGTRRDRRFRPVAARDHDDGAGRSL